ncbi:hypothetical protein PV11_08244 [Exophiala sideris]|uniref:Uncharacterized protein n=1 Tax=Exophiala sideris TaxID=1016849 RepID=A0A0D1WZY5_9EURO|nr:hypothetical protein PV11_08244 [Exophiala sideris]
MLEDTDDALVQQLATHLQHNGGDVERAYNAAPRNVRTVLRRQHVNTIQPKPDNPLCRFIGEDGLMRALGLVQLGLALLTLARVYDECHVALCRSIAAALKGKEDHQHSFGQNPCVDLRLLTEQLENDKATVEDQILLEAAIDGGRKAVWKPVVPMSFDKLPRLQSLAELLPGERSDSREYAGIGGGGGSDIISASLLGLLLRRSGKKRMELLISTRTWATGSQGKQGSKLGVKREVYNDGGPAVEANGRPIAGTFRVNSDTHTEGRDLETIPLSHHSQIFLVLDQGESKAKVPEQERADLKDQFHAVLAQSIRTIDTVLIVDTGGDVFGADSSGETTPDQDLRVQKAISTLSPAYNLVTVVVSPGVDAPADAPVKALKAGGVVYTPSDDEKGRLLDILVNDYKMDGSDPSRFGKTILALQARLRGVVGWTSLDLPTYVVDTWDNPWNCFVYIRQCMSDIILMPTTSLLPLIEPVTTQS